MFDFHCGDISCGNEKMAVNIWGEGLFLPSDFSLTHIRSLRQLVLRLERTACRIDRRVGGCNEISFSIFVASRVPRPCTRPILQVVSAHPRLSAVSSRNFMFHPSATAFGRTQHIHWNNVRSMSPQRRRYADP